VYQGGASKIDRKTKEVTSYPLNKEWLDPNPDQHVTPTNMYVDGKVWMSDNATRSLYRLDIKTGKWENLGEAKTAGGKGISGYGLPTDKNNNVYMMEFSSTNIGRRDAKTGVVDICRRRASARRPAARPLRR